MNKRERNKNNRKRAYVEFRCYKDDNPFEKKKHIKINPYGIGIACLVTLGIGAGIVLNHNSPKGSVKEVKTITIDEDLISTDNSVLETNDNIEDIMASIEKNDIEDKKTEVLNDYEKCETVSEMIERGEELESLNLTKNDKIYKNCKASPEMQHFMYEQANINDLPFDLLLAITHTESRGNFNSGGVTSPTNSDGSHDLGYTQQNSKSSVTDFAKKYGLSYDEAYDLVLNNDYVNVCAAVSILKNIEDQYNKYNAYEYAGCYNGWVNWKNNSTSQTYVYDIFAPAYDNIYTEHHSVEEVKTNTSSDATNKLLVK